MTDYPLIIKQMQSLSEVSADPIAVMANVSSLLYHAMEDVNWAGFYLVKDGGLLLGKIAAHRIRPRDRLYRSAVDSRLSEKS